MNTMTIGGKRYPVTATIRSKMFGEVPLVDIPMMSDFKWQLTALEGRLKDPEGYAKTFGGDIEVVIANLRAWLQEHLDQATPWERQRFERLVV